jgi:hypothetical protein
LVIHSLQDDIIPFAHGERLFEAAGTRSSSLKSMAATTKASSLPARIWIHQKWTDSCAAPFDGRRLASSGAAAVAQ